MEPDFWHERWEKNQIAFHQDVANPALVNHFDQLSLSDGGRVFVPLCGKSLDVGWLLSRGCRVAGVELSQTAVEQLFEGLGTEPEIEQVGELRRYGSQGIDVFVGDFFDLDAGMLGGVEAVYDRAALVALPPDMRRRYAAHLATVTGGAPQLLLTFTYDQSVAPGPPFSVGAEEIRRLYAASHGLACLESRELGGAGNQGAFPAEEHVWLLRPLGAPNADDEPVARPGID